MKKTLKELRENKSPLAEEPAVLAVAQDIDRYAGIAAFNDSEGGKELRKALRSDIVAAINDILRLYGRSEEKELFASISKVDARISLLQAMGNAKQNQQDAEKVFDELTS